MTEPRHNSYLRERLDAVRPDSDDLADPDFREASEAVESSLAWRETFEAQRHFDRHVADAMLDVDPPAGARERLLEKLAEARSQAAGASPSHSSSETATPHNQRLGRRRWGYLVTAAAGIAACIGLGLLLWTGDPRTLTLDEIRSRVPVDSANRIDVSGLEPFDGSFPVTIPVGSWDRVRFDDPLGIDWSYDSRHDAAILPFVSRGRVPVSGYLLILPASAVSSPPVRTFLSTAEISYFPVENAAWTSTTGELVYVCFVDSGKLDELRGMLYPRQA